MVIPFFTGAGNFFKNLWTGLTGADTAGYYTPKQFSKDPSTIPAGSITLERSNDEWLGGAIRKVTKEWANHSIVNSYNGVTIEAESGGVTNDKMASHINLKSQLIIFTNTKETPMQAVGTVAFAQGCVGKDYNWFGIFFGFLVGGDDSSNKTDFCSELAARATASQNIPSTDKAPELTSPGDQLNFFLSPVGIAAGWVIWDTRNILLSDVIKTISK
jgi:hypothetical protein